MAKVITLILVLTFLLENLSDASSKPKTVTLSHESQHQVYVGRCEDMGGGLSLNLRDVGLRRLDSGFTHSPHITCLNLEDNDIAYVSPTCLDSLPNLLYVNLARNNLSLTIASKLQGHPHLRTLVLDNNRILDDNAILEFSNTFPELSYVYLRNCSIEDIASLSFAPRLLYLNMSANNLGKSKLGFLNDDVATTLMALDLSYNGIENLNASGLYTLLRLRLDGNKFQRLCGKSYCNEAVLMLEGATNLQWLSLSANELTSVESDAFDDSVNIQYLDLSRNNINSVQKGTFEKLEELKFLSLEGNLLKTIPELCNLESLRHLYLAKNYLHTVNNDSFCQIENLTHVDLSDNKIKVVEAGALERLIRLKVLKLSNNLIANFSNSWLENLRDLRSLYVDGNRLKNLRDFGLAGVHMFARLENVFAQNNLIDKLYTGSLHSEVRNKPNITIQLFDFDSPRTIVSDDEDCNCDCLWEDNEV